MNLKQTILFLIFSFCCFAQTEEEFLKVKKTGNLAYKYFKEKAFKESLDLLNEILKNPIKNPFLKEGKPLPSEELKKKLDKNVIKLSREYGEAYFLRAIIRYDLQQYLEALEDINHSIEYRYPTRLVYSYRVFILRKLFRSQETLDDLNLLISVYNSKEGMYYKFRGEVQFFMGNFNSALEDFNKAILLDPEDPQTYAHRGLLNDKQNQLEKSLADFNKALSLPIESEDKFQVYAYRGALKKKQGDLKGAFEDCNLSIQMEPTAFNYNLRADLKSESGDFAGALEDYNTSIELDPECKLFTATYINRGNFFYKMQDFSNAKKDYQKYLELTDSIKLNFMIEKNRKQAEEKLLLLQYD
jgi:tetratricopeptide (TPR) repeat protein